MCMKSVVRRFGAFLASLVLCFSLTVPALADSAVSCTGTFYLGSTSQAGSDTFSVSSGNSYSNRSDKSKSSQLYCVILTPSDFVSADGGVYTVYLSYYYKYSASGGSGQSVTPTADMFYMLYTKNDSGALYCENVTDFARWTPTGNYVSDGVTLTARFDNSLGDPIDGDEWYISGSASTGSSSPTFYLPKLSGAYTYTIVSSFRVVSTSTSADAEALEGIADSITAQNSLLSSYYGDIVAICNQIYQRLGDMQATQQEANALLSSLVSLLDTTNGKISALNQAMSTYFELVLKSLENESLSIQDCINDAELRLETYLKPIVDYFTELEETTGESASSLPQHKTDLNKWSSDSTGIDADAQTGLAAILPFLSAFSFVFQILGIVIGLGIFRVIIKKGAS